MTYSITLRNPDGEENVIDCAEDQYILEAADCLLYTSPSPRD